MTKKKRLENDKANFERKASILIAEIQKDIFKNVSAEKRKEIERISSESTRIYKESLAASS